MPEMGREYVSTERFIPNGMKKTTFWNTPVTSYLFLIMIYFVGGKSLHCTEGVRSLAESRCTVQEAFARWRKVAEQCRRLSLVGGRSLHNAGGFRSLAEGRCTMQETFARWRKVAAQCRRRSLVGGKSLHSTGGFRSLAEGRCQDLMPIPSAPHSQFSILNSNRRLRLIFNFQFSIFNSLLVSAAL
jgi:hypothetical protein